MYASDEHQVNSSSKHNGEIPRARTSVGSHHSSTHTSVCDSRHFFFIMSPNRMYTAVSACMRFASKLRYQRELSELPNRIGTMHVAQLQLCAQLCYSTVFVCVGLAFPFFNHANARELSPVILIFLLAGLSYIHLILMHVTPQGSGGPACCLVGTLLHTPLQYSLYSESLYYFVRSHSI